MLLQSAAAGKPALENSTNKAIVDYTSPALCIPVTHFPPIGDAAYREHNRATDVGNMHKNW